MEEKDIEKKNPEEIDNQENDDASNKDRRTFIKKAAVTAAAVSGIALGLAKKSEAQLWGAKTQVNPFGTAAPSTSLFAPARPAQPAQTVQPVQPTQPAPTQPTKLALRPENIRHQMDMKQNMVRDLGMAAQELQNTNDIGKFVPAALDRIHEYTESLVDAHLGPMGSQAADYNITAVTDNVTISGDIVYGKDLREEALNADSLMGGLFRK